MIFKRDHYTIRYDTIRYDTLQYDTIPYYISIYSMTQINDLKRQQNVEIKMVL